MSSDVVELVDSALKHLAAALHHYRQGVNYQQLFGHAFYYHRYSRQSFEFSDKAHLAREVSSWYYYEIDTSFDLKFRGILRTFLTSSAIA